MENKPLNFILFGRSGSGKGTQADLLIKKFGNTLKISSGDLLRNLAEQDTDAGRKIKEVLINGGLPFSQIASTLWMHEIAYSLKDDQGLICDGFPRRPEEANDLYEFLKWLDRIDYTKVLLIEISREEAFKRLIARGRIDDKEKAINERLDWYDEFVVPAINFFRDKGLIIDINGEQSIEKIHEDIMDKLS